MARITVNNIYRGNRSFNNGPLFTDRGNLTNGNWLILKDFIPKNLLKKALTKSGPIEPHRLWKNINKAKPATFLAEEADCFIFTFDGGVEQEEIVFLKKYILFFRKWIPIFSIKASGSQEPACIYSDSELAGLLMPYRL